MLVLRPTRSAKHVAKQLCQDSVADRALTAKPCLHGKQKADEKERSTSEGGAAPPTQLAIHLATATTFTCTCMWNQLSSKRFEGRRA